MRRILPIDRSTESGSRTLVVTVTPMVFFTRADSWVPASAASGGVVPVGVDVHGQLIHPAFSGQVKLEVRRKRGNAHYEFLDLGREQVDPA